MEEVELHLPPDVAYVGLARLIVCAAARQAGMTEERVEDLRIAVSEATANAVASRSSAERAAPDADSVVLSFGRRGDRGFGVCIAGVDSEVPAPGADELKGELADEIGLGVTVIRGLADEVRFVQRGARLDLEFTVALSDDTKTSAGGGAEAL